MPPDDRAPYHVCAWGPSRPHEIVYYALPLRQRLPRVAIPLRPSDDAVVLDLQDLIETCYRRGRYDDIDYAEALRPPLEPEDAQWAEALLRERGLR